MTRFLPALRELFICSSLGPQMLEPEQTPILQWLHYNANCIPKVCVCCYSESIVWEGIFASRQPWGSSCNIKSSLSL